MRFFVIVVLFLCICITESYDRKETAAYSSDKHNIVHITRNASLSTDLRLLLETNQQPVTEIIPKSVQGPGIFWNHMTDNDFLKEIEKAERSLKIYIYPVPHDEITTKLKDGGLPHFQSEFLFKKYLKVYNSSNSDISDSDSRKHMVVDDPSQANAFLIDHDWMRYTRHDCGGALDKHIAVIIHNVVDLHPYYNRSGGRDHFFMAVYDHGAFCDMQCADKGNKNVLQRIDGASFIGNYGMDRASFYLEGTTTLRENYKRFGVACHRPDKDIVIPQLIHGSTMAMFDGHNMTHIPYREYDATFSGSPWFDRAPAKKMSYTADIDYHYNGTEKFGYYIEGGSPDNSLKFRGYFMYNPCGGACWSQRLYEALAVYTVPVIITDGGIQAFERFIDWRTISVKMNLSTWYHEDKRNTYRHKIRVESETFRNKLTSCWSSLAISIAKGDLKDPCQRNISWLDAANSGHHPICAEVLDTFYWKKSQAIARATPWLDFNEPHKTKINAFRLLTLEIWCHSVSWQNNTTIPSICNHRPDYTARLEYFR